MGQERCGYLRGISPWLEQQFDEAVAAAERSLNPPLAGAQQEVNRGRKLGCHLLDDDFGFHLAEFRFERLLPTYANHLSVFKSFIMQLVVAP